MVFFPVFAYPSISRCETQAIHTRCARVGAEKHATITVLCACPRKAVFNAANKYDVRNGLQANNTGL